ncbi:MAG TPA: hypothetical protein VKQ30_12590 [Ktedonobacterales bacterium]|nr:hypothetical protein [Ktedonobacterales bacterium]
MTTAIRKEAVVGPDGKIEISAPELTPGQRVTVTIQAEAPEERQGPHVIDIIKDLPGGRLFKTAEEVDAYIREERESWDR